MLKLWFNELEKNKNDDDERRKRMAEVDKRLTSIEASLNAYSMAHPPGTKINFCGKQIVIGKIYSRNYLGAATYVEIGTLPPFAPHMDRVEAEIYYFAKDGLQVRTVPYSLILAADKGLEDCPGPNARDNIFNANDAIAKITPEPGKKIFVDSASDDLSFQEWVDTILLIRRFDDGGHMQAWTMGAWDAWKHLKKEEP